MHIYSHTLYEWIQHNTDTHESLSSSHDKKKLFHPPLFDYYFHWESVTQIEFLLEKISKNDGILSECNNCISILSIDIILMKLISYFLGYKWSIGYISKKKFICKSLNIMWIISFFFKYALLCENGSYEISANQNQNISCVYQ